MSRYEGQGDERPLSPQEPVQSLSVRRQLRDDGGPADSAPTPETDAARDVNYKLSIFNKIEAERQYERAEKAEAELAAAKERIAWFMDEHEADNRTIANLGKRLEEATKRVEDAERDEFRNDLEGVINRHSMENGSNTPDFMLADYLIKCLHDLDKVINNRASWYGRFDRPGA